MTTPRPDILAYQREFWNVADLDTAKFERICVSQDFRDATPAERERMFRADGLAEARRVLADLPWTRYWKALEIGCGIGRIILPLRRWLFAVNGVDIAPNMVAWSEEYLAGAGHGHVDLTDGALLPNFAEGVYDLVYSVYTFQHIRSAAVVQSYLSEALRVLRAGGWIRLQTQLPNARLGTAETEAAPGEDFGFSGNAYTADEMQALLSTAGFVDAGAVVENTSLWTTARKESA